MNDREVTRWGDAIRALLPKGFLMVSGKLPKEPMASYGAFLMNTPEKIQQAPRRPEKNQHAVK